MVQYATEGFNLFDIMLMMIFMFQWGEHVVCASCLTSSGDLFRLVSFSGELFWPILTKPFIVVSQLWFCSVACKCVSLKSHLEVWYVFIILFVSLCQVSRQQVVEFTPGVWRQPQTQDWRHELKRRDTDSLFVIIMLVILLPNELIVVKGWIITSF